MPSPSQGFLFSQLEVLEPIPLVRGGRNSLGDHPKMIPTAMVESVVQSLSLKGEPRKN